MKPLKLVSFDICPFVQRSIIVLKEKGIPFEAIYIDILDKPDWFLEISPFGKVPLLKVGNTTLFESAVINEYLEDEFEPHLHPSDNLERAKHRAWIEYSSDLIMKQYRLLSATEVDTYESALGILITSLENLENFKEKETTYFSSDKFQLIDCAFAPIFTRLKILSEMDAKKDILNKLEYMHNWSEAVLSRKSVINSCPEGFESSFYNFFTERNSFALRNS